jgi:hypothetical protein
MPDHADDVVDVDQKASAVRRVGSWPLWDGGRGNMPTALPYVLVVRVIGLLWTITSTPYVAPMR